MCLPAKRDHIKSNKVIIIDIAIQLYQILLHNVQLAATQKIAVFDRSAASFDAKNAPTDCSNDTIKNITIINATKLTAIYFIQFKKLI